MINRAATIPRWSGYVDAGGTYWGVFAYWTVPAVSDVRPARPGWASAAGSAPSGTSSIKVRYHGCRGSRAVRLVGDIPADKVAIPATVRPGNLMFGQMQRSCDTYTFRLTTRPAIGSASLQKKESGLADNSAEVIAEAPFYDKVEQPLADFGTVQFTRAHVNGVAIGSLNPTKVTMANPHTDTSVSGLSNMSFTVTWLARGIG